jgi:hypothetical protein
MSAEAVFDPRNRYVLLTDVSVNTDEESTILLPEDYTAKRSPYGVYQLEQISTDCQKVSVEDLGKLVMVNDSMVETASLDQGSFLLVQENHVYGVIG